MRNIAFLCILLLVCLDLSSCAIRPDKKKDKLKTIVYKLLNCLENRDSLCVSKLFKNKNDWALKRDDIIDDCKIACNIMKKYGLPSPGQLSITYSELQGHMVRIPLLSTPDSILNYKKCELIVYFGSDGLAENENKIYNYVIYLDLLNIKPKDVIKAPDIKME